MDFCSVCGNTHDSFWGVHFERLWEEHLSRIEEIRQAIVEKEKDDNDFFYWATGVAKGIANGFRDFVGLPESYQAIDGPPQRYIEFFEVNPEANEIGAKQIHASKALNVLVDGQVKFALGIVLDRGENVFPKKRYLFVVEFKKDLEGLSISIGEQKTVRCKPIAGSEEHDLTPAFEALYQLIMERLRSRIGDGNHLQRIGFDTRPA